PRDCGSRPIDFSLRRRKAHPQRRQIDVHSLALDGPYDLEMPKRYWPVAGHQRFGASIVRTISRERLSFVVVALHALARNVSTRGRSGAALGFAVCHRNCVLNTTKIGAEASQQRCGERLVFAASPAIDRGPKFEERCDRA